MNFEDFFSSLMSVCETEKERETLLKCEGNLAEAWEDYKDMYEDYKDMYGENDIQSLNELINS